MYNTWILNFLFKNWSYIIVEYFTWFLLGNERTNNIKQKNIKVNVRTYVDGYVLSLF